MAEKKSPVTIKDKLQAKIDAEGNEIPAVDPDLAIMTGHPADTDDIQNDDDADDNESAENLEEVEIGGIRYMVAPAVASAMRTKAADPDIPVRKVEDDLIVEDDPLQVDELALFSDPDAYLKKFGEDLTNKIKKDLRKEYGQQSSQDNFWRDFYGENPELSKYKDIVKLVLNKNINTLGEMTVDKSIPELVNMSRAYILQMSKDFNKGSSEKNGTQSLTGSSKTPSSASDNKEQDDEESSKEPSSLSAAIRQRQAKRESGLSQNVV